MERVMRPDHLIQMILVTDDKSRIREQLICFADFVADHSSRRGRFSIPHVQDEERTMLPILTRPEKKKKKTLGSG